MDRADIVCKYCEESKRIMENGDDGWDSAYAIIENSEGWFFTSCREHKFETYPINYCPICGRKLGE